MFSSGLVPTPLITSHDLSLCSGAESELPPSGDFVVAEVQVCGTIYNVDLVFSDQADFINWLNTTLVPIFGLSGEFTAVSNHLIYSSSEDCTGINCLTIGDWQQNEETERVAIMEDASNYFNIE